MQGLTPQSVIGLRSTNGETADTGFEKRPREQCCESALTEYVAVGPTYYSKRGHVTGDKRTAHMDHGNSNHNGTSAATSPQHFWAEWRDAVEPRTVALIVGVLFLQLGFILSYVGTFHAPKPHEIPVVVVAPTSYSTKIIAELNGLTTSPLKARVVSSVSVAKKGIRTDQTSAVFIFNPQSRTDKLLVTTAGGSAVVKAVTTVVTQFETAQSRSVSVIDLVPGQSGDQSGLAGFYLVIGWIVGGYLVASLLGVARGSRPANRRRAIFRLGAIIPYALLSGLGGALVVDQLLNALTGHFVALWLLGALLVASAATVTMAFQVLFGVFGIGVTVLLFVILGNPSAGGAYQPSVLPPFWRTLSGALPNGAGTDAVRRIVYFGANGIGGNLVVISLYVVGGVFATIVGTHFHHRRTTRLEQLPSTA